MRYDHATKKLPTLEEWDAMGKGELYCVCRRMDELTCEGEKGTRGEMIRSVGWRIGDRRS